MTSNWEKKRKENNLKDFPKHNLWGKKENLFMDELSKSNKVKCLASVEIF